MKKVNAMRVPEAHHPRQKDNAYSHPGINGWEHGGIQDIVNNIFRCLRAGASGYSGHAIPS